MVLALSERDFLVGEELILGSTVYLFIKLDLKFDWQARIFKGLQYPLKVLPKEKDALAVLVSTNFLTNKKL